MDLEEVLDRMKKYKKFKTLKSDMRVEVRVSNNGKNYIEIAEWFEVINISPPPKGIVEEDYQIIYLFLDDEDKIIWIVYENTENENRKKIENEFKIGTKIILN